MRKLALFVALFFMGFSASAQVTVTKPAEAASEDISRPCPMQIDLPLGANPELKRRGFADLPLGHTWLSTEMRQYVCHTERIAMVALRRVKERRKKVELTIQPTVKSEQWRQDVDLIVSLVAPDGKEYCRFKKSNLTVGKDRAISSVTWVTLASSTKRPLFDCKLSKADYDSLFAGSEAPVLRIILAPQLDTEDKK